VRLQLSREPASLTEADLAGDGFFELFLQTPCAVTPPPQERAINRALLDWVTGTRSWEESKAPVVGNLPASIASASLLWELLTSEEALKAALEKQEEAAKAAEEARVQEVLAQAFSAAGMEAEARAAAEAASQAQARVQAALAQAEEALAAARQDAMVQAAVASAARQAGKAGQEVVQAMAGWGLGPGSAVRVDPQAALEFLRRNSAKLRRIAELAGRMRGIALQTSRENVPTGPVPVDTGLVEDLTAIFPDELALLHPGAPSLIRAQAVARWAQGGLLGWKLAGQADRRGPFVAAVDVSGSMAGEREMVAKGVALGVAQAAKAEGRKYILFTFGADQDPIVVCTSDDDWEAHIAWAEQAAHGGTSFNRALQEAMERLGEDRRADLLFISDGEAWVADELAQAWLGFKRERGCRLLYVPVASGYGSMEKLADIVIPVSELDVQSGDDLTRSIVGSL